MEYSKKSTVGQESKIQMGISRIIPSTPKSTPPIPAEGNKGVTQSSPFPFELIVLDFDQTMAFTAPLEASRSAVNKPEDWEEQVGNLKSNPGMVRFLEVIKSLPEPPKIIVLSAARKWYLEDLLKRWFPGIQFDAVISYDDARDANQAYKPNPLLLLRYMESNSISSDKTVVIGDSRKDIELAYRAGVRSILVNFYYREITAYLQQIANQTKSSPKKDNEYFYALEALPHAVCDNPFQLKEIIKNITRYDLPLETLLDGEKLQDNKRERKHYTLRRFTGIPEDKRSIVVQILGRHISSQSTNSARHHLPMRENHKLTHQILNKEAGISDVPQEWVLALAHEIKKIVESPFEIAGFPCDSFIVTIVPSKKGRPPRNENLLKAVAEKLSRFGNIEFESEVFHFLEGAQSNKNLDRAGRRQNLLNLVLKNPETASREKCYIVVDDVCTTGETFFRCLDLLESKEARVSSFITISKALSFGGR